jgi:hypothetical protein
VHFLPLCENADPAPAQGVHVREEFKATEAEAEVHHEGVHLGRLAHQICLIPFPEDHIRICEVPKTGEEGEDTEEDAKMGVRGVCMVCESVEGRAGQTCVWAYEGRVLAGGVLLLCRQ